MKHKYRKNLFPFVFTHLKAYCQYKRNYNLIFLTYMNSGVFMSLHSLHRTFKGHLNLICQL